MDPFRSTEITSHDDGVNAWRTVRMAAARHLHGAVYGYSDYAERTRGFTVRRELPHADGVLIVNLGDTITITGGDGVEIRVGPGEAFVAGAHLRPALSRSIGSQAGVHVFLPLTTLRRLIGAPLHEWVDRVVTLEGPLRSMAQTLGEAKTAENRAAALDEALMAHLLRAPALGARRTRALALLRMQPGRDIADIAEEVGWSRKHLAQQVRDAIGVGPRAFRRLLRFQRATQVLKATVAPPNWARLAQDAGYCDQSHMIREFKEFGGLTPGACFARALPDGGGLVEASGAFRPIAAAQNLR